MHLDILFFLPSLSPLVDTHNFSHSSGSRARIGERRSHSDFEVDGSEESQINARRDFSLFSGNELWLVPVD